MLPTRMSCFGGVFMPSFKFSRRRRRNTSTPQSPPPPDPPPPVSTTQGQEESEMSKRHADDPKANLAPNSDDKRSKVDVLEELKQRRSKISSQIDFLNDDLMKANSSRDQPKAKGSIARG